LTIKPPHFRVRTFHPAPGIHVTSRDRDFRPARRRGFDDDNYEVPWSNFRSAPEFSAQRFDPPSGPRIQAVVKWYNPEKGFGFVQLADGSGESSSAAATIAYRRARRSKFAPVPAPRGRR
jgi:hypothetical protein